MSDDSATSGSGGAVPVLLRTANTIDRVTEKIGHAVAYLTFATVYLRYAVNIGVIWLQDLYVWTHVAAIMLGAGYVLLRGGFVRVDLLYSHMSARGRAWVDLLGTIFLMWPFLGMMAVSGWQFFMLSYRMNEAAQQETGLNAIYLIKTSLMFFVVVVGLQGMSIIARSLATILSPRIAQPVADTKPAEVV